MRRRVPQAVSLCLLAGLVFPGAQGFPVIAAETEAVAEADGETVSNTATDAELVDESDAGTEEAGSDEALLDTEESADDEEDSLVGELIFAQCEDYVNIRSEGSTDGEITAKIYNNGSATVMSVDEDGEWYEITSGNAHGYVKAEYFATGEAAEAIAEEVAYNVATVQVEYLNIRSEASTDSDVIDVVPESAQIEVVLYGDDWMKVALGSDVYGYIKTEYVDYTTYYPVAETLEEEEARLLEEAALFSASAETEAAQSETVAETAETTEALPAETTVETEAVQTETVQTEATAVQAETTAQTETTVTQTETTTQTETEAAQTETTAQTET
ncbi:MAG: SH3 domain-containing protein, partial [Lachnospiraceae bacterium]|nr:SH3 domain-containing protein [Lachnospiraceae bacterium]